MIIPKMKLAIPFVIVFLLLGVLWKELSSTRTTEFNEGIVGDKVPSFNLSSLDGASTVSNQNLNGQVMILNFFASWCSACRKEHAMLLKIKNEYHVPIIGIAFKDDPNDTKQFLAQDGNPYQDVGNDVNGDTAVDFGIYATPETFVISPSGDIVYKQIGVIDQQTWDTDIYPIIKKYLR